MDAAVLVNTLLKFLLLSSKEFPDLHPFQNCAFLVVRYAPTPPHHNFKAIKAMALKRGGCIVHPKLFPLRYAK